MPAPTLARSAWACALLAVSVVVGVEGAHHTAWWQFSTLGESVPPPARSDRRVDAHPLPPPTRSNAPVTSPGSFWPQPAVVSQGSGGCATLASSFRFINTAPSSTILTAGVARYNGILFAYGSNDASLSNLPATLANATVSVSSLDERLPFRVDESYNISITVPAAGGGPPAASITAVTVWGALRGLETFSQMAQRNFTAPPAGGYYYVCAVAIEDAPRFPYRGLLVDVSRHYFNVTAIKGVMELMSALKMNQMHLHLTDDQSWPLVVPQYPLLTQVGAFTPLHVYNTSDLADLVSFALHRGITIIPEIESPSHNSQMLNAYPEFGCLATDPTSNTTYRCMVDPSNPDFYTFYATMWSHMDAIFPKEWPFAIGGDEVFFSCWQNCPAAMAFFNASGLDVRGGYYWFERKLVSTLAPLNRTLIAWEDIAGFANGSFTANGLSNVWIEQWDGAPGVWNWDAYELIAMNATTIIAGPYSILHTPQQDYSADLFNLSSPLTPYQQKLVAGPELMLWDDAQDTDGGDVLVAAMQTILAIAETSWSPQSLTHGATIDSARYQDMRCRLLSRLVQSHPWLPTGSYCTPEYPGMLPPWSTRG